MLACIIHRCRHTVWGVSLLILLMGAMAGPAKADGPVAVIVQVAAGVDTAVLAADYNAAVVNHLPALALARLQGSHPQLAAQLAADPRVLAAHADGVIVGQPRLIGAVNGTMDAQPRLIGAVGDPVAYYGEQWAVSKMRLPQAHAISQGQGITVAVLDTGVLLAHPLLSGHLVAGYDFVDDDAVPDDVADGLDEDGDGVVDEDAGHGTHVAGIILLAAPQAHIMPVRIFNDEGKGTYFDAIAGIVYAVDHGADIINLSGSGPDDVPFMAQAVAYAESQGVVMVAAGGVNALGYPASYNAVISVGAANEEDYLTDFSDFAQMANTVYAPGLSIFSGYYDGDYAWWTGNSMATPLVAGTAALLLATGSCDAVCVRSTIVTTAHAVVIDPGTQMLYGRVDAFDAVAAAANQGDVNLSVQLMHGSGQPDDQDIKPYLRIINHGNSVPLEQLTLRYYYTLEGNSSQQFHCDYAAVGCGHMTGVFGQVTGTTEADTYLEVRFTAGAGILLGNHNSGPLQLRFNKENWTAYNELNDYSRNGAAVYTETLNVALFHNGVLVWGTPPGNQPPPPAQPPPPPAPSGLRVQYRTTDANPTNQEMKPFFQLVNGGDTAVPLSVLRVRYWFTDPDTAVSQFHCDYAVVGCGHVTAVFGSVNGQKYMEIHFASGAGVLPAGGQTGEIQLRLHHTDWSAYHEANDHSYAPSFTTLTDWQNVTLYHNEQLIWGVVP